MKKWTVKLLIGAILVVGSVFGYAILTPKMPNKNHVNYTAKALSSCPRISTISHFLSDEECDYLITLARPGLERSTVVDESGSMHSVLDDRRTSEGMFLANNEKDPILQRIEARIADLTQIPQENGEQLQILHYGVGGEFQPHYDYFYSDTAGGKANLERGGQRVVTVIMYLNTPEAGGETIFPEAHKSVTPMKGSAVMFHNCLPSGVEDPLTLHGGAPVKAGEKWIANKWMRKGTFH